MADDTPVYPDDVSDALRSAQDNRDPDTIPAGGVQATTTEEAKQQARRLLGRVGTGDAEAAKLKEDIESNAAASKAALIRAQRMLMANPQVLFPSQAEIAHRQGAALMAPHPGVPMSGALTAEFGNLYNEEAAEEAQQREALRQALSIQSGAPLQEQLSKINEQSAAARQKLLDMQTKSNTELGRAAMTTLGRVSASPANQKSVSPNSQFGKIALDALGPRAYVTPGDPTSGFSDLYRQKVNQLNDAAVSEAKARAGIDATEPTPEEKYAGAQQVGVPVAPPGLPDTTKMATKQRQQYYQNAEKTFEKQQSDYGAADEQTRAALRALDEFQDLNKVTHTGQDLAPWYLGGAHAGPHGVGADLSQEHGGLNLNPMSFLAGFTSNIQRMQKLAAQVVAQAIPPKGFGRVTNRDLNLFQSGSIGIDKTQQTNDAISQALRIRLNNDLQRHQFEQAYFGLHRSTDGSENSWNDYLENNPIFDPNVKTKGGQLPSLNPKRMPWQDYFRTKNGPLESAPVETVEGHQSNLTKEQLHGADPNAPELEGLSDQEKIAATTPAHAEGGRIGFDDGGSVGKTEGDDALTSLLNGLRMKVGASPEDSERPLTNFVGEGAGAGLTAAAALLALKRKAGIADLIREHPNLTAAGVGGITGGVVGEANDMDPAVTAGGGAMLAIPSRFAGSKATELLQNLRNRVDAGPGVRRSLQALSADDPEFDQKLLADRKLGVPSTLGETGPRSLGLTSSAIRKDTPESNELLSQLQERQAGAPGRASDLVNSAMAPDDYYAKTEQLRSNLYTKAAPLYDEAFKQFPSIQSQALSQIMQTPSGQEAVLRATKMMQDQRLPVAQPGSNGVSLQFLDQVKRGLDDMILKEEGTGPAYQATQQGRVLRQLRSSLVDELDKSTMGENGAPSPYRAARDQYAGDLDLLDSLRSGRELFPKQTAEEVRQIMQKLDFSSRDAYRSGVAEGIFQNISGMGGGANAAQRVIGNPKLQEKISAMFDNPTQAQRFITALSREGAIFASGKKLVTAGEKGMETSMSPTSVSQMLRASLMRKGTAGEVADTMSTAATDPDVKEKIARLRGIADRLRVQKDVSGIAGQGTAAGVAAASTPTPMVQNQQGQ